MNVYALCNVGASVLVGHLLALQEGNAVGLMTKESSINFRQGKSFSHLPNIQTASEASPTYSVCAEVKWLGQEVNHLYLSSTREECVELYFLYPHIPLYPHCVVLNETWRQLYLA
jgi:hypothetical protein